MYKVQKTFLVFRSHSFEVSYATLLYKDNLYLVSTILFLNLLFAWFLFYQIVFISKLYMLENNIKMKLQINGFHETFLVLHITIFSFSYNKNGFCYKKNKVCSCV